MFDQLLADAQVAYALGRVKPGRGRYTNGKIACAVAAAWLQNHATGFRPNSFMGQWAMRQYNLSRDAAQGFLDGWDGQREPQGDSEDALSGYAAGRAAALIIVGPK